MRYFALIFGCSLSALSCHEEPVLGDFNGDGCINLQDYTRLARCWERKASACSNPDVDLSGNGVVDYADYLLFLDQWDEYHCADVSGVPGAPSSPSGAPAPSLTSTATSAKVPAPVPAPTTPAPTSSAPAVPAPTASAPATPAPAPAPTTPAPAPTPATPAPAPKSMRWDIVDGCEDTGDLQVRFFDMTNDLVWPSADKVWVIENGGSQAFDLGCRSGAKICYGATAKDSSGKYRIWGAGIDGKNGCEKCCITCELGATTGGTLVCK